MKLLKNLILVYEDFPCYNIYHSIITVNYFFLGINKIKINNSNINIIRVKEKIIKKKIRFPREFKNLKMRKYFKLA